MIIPREKSRRDERLEEIKVICLGSKADRDESIPRRMLAPRNLGETPADIGWPRGLIVSCPSPMLPDPSDLLRRDVSMLGHLLGDTLVEQEGREFFDLEEKIRALAKRRRGSDIEAGLDQRVLQPPQRRRIVLDEQDRDLLR